MFSYQYMSLHCLHSFLCLGNKNNQAFIRFYCDKHWVNGRTVIVQHFFNFNQATYGQLTFK